MIKTITELSNGLWQNINTINTIKPISPVTGDIYYDSTANRNYVFDGGNWKELKVTSKDIIFNRKRMRKINNIFGEK